MATLRGALAARTPTPLTNSGTDSSELALPADHPWAERLAERPMLRALLEDHVARAHHQRALGAPTEGLPAPVAALVDAGWGAPVDLPAWRALGDFPAARVVPVGFSVGGGPRGGSGLAERLLLDTTGGQRTP